MSVRSDPKEMSPGMQQALMIPQDVMRSAAQQSADGQLMAPAPAGTELALSGNGVGNEQHLAQANEFNTSNPNHPLKRTVVINIRSSLADLCLKKSRATWSPPSAEATKAILQQRKFVDLQGTSEQQGDLKSIVLHKMALRSQQSTYPVALGVRITGVDDATFSQTGEAFSTITLPEMNSQTELSLQEDDTELAYEFVRTSRIEPTTAPQHYHAYTTPTRTGAQVPRVHCRQPLREYPSPFEHLTKRDTL